MNWSAEKPERIAKAIAAAGLCSRREAEAWITAGRVSVNGQKLASPACTVTSADAILVDGKPLPVMQETRLYRYHKPEGELCTTTDPHGRKTIFESLPANMPRVVNVGRLDVNSAGLLLFTTSGDLAQDLMRGDLPRTYRVRIMGDVTEQKISRLTKGITVEGIRYKPMTVSFDTSHKQGRNQWLTITLTEGKNREIRRVCEAVGWQVNRLLRTAYGPFELADLKPGEIVEVPARQVRKLVRKENVHAS